MSEKTLLEVKNLSVEYHTDELTVKAVNDVNLKVNHRQTLGLVGETGAGKTTLALSLLRLLPKGIGEVTSGTVEFEGRNLMEVKEADMLAYRGKQISMIFQDPMTSLNPRLTVSELIAEPLIAGHIYKNVERIIVSDVSGCYDTGFCHRSRRSKKG